MPAKLRARSPRAPPYTPAGKIDANSRRIMLTVTSARQWLFHGTVAAHGGAPLAPPLLASVDDGASVPAAPAIPPSEGPRGKPLGTP